MTPMLRLLVLVCFFVLTDTGIAAEPRQRASNSIDSQARVALVIGNSAYPGSAALKNPANDANDIATKLKRFGFNVTLRTNVALRDMLRTLTEFGDKVQPGSEVLFFYAGHGMQVKGKNYLIPIDAEIRNESAVSSEAVDVDQLLDKLAPARLSMVILDACRNNPFERRFRGGGQGLASINAPTGTLIAYATAPGKVAADGDGRNGLYTQELLAAMDTPGIKVEDVFKRVRANVVKKSGDAQTPWESSSLTGDFFFSHQHASSPPSVAQTVPSDGARSPQQIEDELWDMIKESNKAAMFEEYLSGYPTGRYVTQARIKLRSLKEGSPPLDLGVQPMASGNKSIRRIGFIDAKQISSAVGSSESDLSKINAKITEYAKKHRLDYVLQTAVSVASHLDITDAIIQSVRGRSSRAPTNGAEVRRIAFVNVNKLLDELGPKNSDLGSLNKTVIDFAKRFDVQLVIQEAVWVDSGIDVTDLLIKFHRNAPLNDAELTRVRSSREIRMGFVSVDKMFEKSPAPLAAKARLEREFHLRDRELVTMGAKLQVMPNSAEKSSLTSTFQRLQSEFKSDLDRRKNEELVAVLKELNAHIQGFAKNGSYTLILDQGQVVYVDPRHDITDSLLASLRK